MHPARSAVVVAESQAGPRGGSGPVHFASTVGCPLPASLASLLAVPASVTAPSAGRQLTEGASAPLDRLSSQAAMALRFVLTNFSTALPMAAVHGDSPAARATGAEKTDAATTIARNRLCIVSPPRPVPWGHRWRGSTTQRGSQTRENGRARVRIALFRSAARAAASRTPLRA